jgi:hypothetical protein
MQQALERRNNIGVSRGAYYRVLSQARNNLKKSLFTVATSVQLGVVKPEDVEKLLTIVSRVPFDLEEGPSREVTELLTALADRIVMS